MGWKGVYPLHELREGFENAVETDVIQKEDIIDLTAHFDGENINLGCPCPGTGW